MNAAELTAKLNANKAGSGWSAKCPAHADHNASLSITEGAGGRVLLHCHAGCPTDAVLDKLGLVISDLFPGKTTDVKPQLVKTYDYHDACGQLLFQVCRYEPKTFRQRRPDGKGGWIWNMDGVTRVLFRLPRIQEQVRLEGDVFIVEGEKDVEALEQLGLCTTTNPGGAGKGKWLPAFSETLRGAHIIIIAHRDDPGRQHAATVAEAIGDAVAKVRVIELPDRDGKPVKDAADWVAAGGTWEDMCGIIESAKPSLPPVVKPATEEDQDAVKLRSDLFKAKMKRGLTAEERNVEMAQVVLATLHRRGRFFFHAEFTDHATSMFFDAGRKLLLKISSDVFQSWLADFIGVNRVEKTFASIFAAIQDETLVGATTGLLPETYWAHRAGAIYLSCGDGQVVKISSSSVALVDNGTDDVLFAAGCTLRTWRLAAPADPFESCRLFSGMKVSTDHGHDLFRLWVTALPSDQRCKPPLVLAGDVGSGKTRAALGICELYGLPPRVLVPTEKGEDDFWTSLNAGGLVILDNADTRLRWLPDALAAASTNGSHEKRRLYTDNQIVRQQARAWVCITSANPTFGSDAGLADRLLVERLARRESDNAETELSDEIAAARDAGLSWIAKTLSKVLADSAPVPKDLNKRHPDFAAFAVRIGRALGREAEAVTALQSAEADKGLFNLENDDLGAALLDHIQRDGTFSGTASDLGAKLTDLDAKYWTPRRIAKRLVKLWPYVTGVFNATSNLGHAGIKTYTISRHGGFGGFETPISPLIPGNENVGALYETAPPNPPNPPPDDSGSAENQELDYDEPYS
jgi:5S rRNA maturation endonuclease (ribonuclease M5)